MASASPVMMMSPVAFFSPVLYALPYPFRFSVITLAPFCCAMCCVWSLDPPSMTSISS